LSGGGGSRSADSPDLAGPLLRSGRAVAARSSAPSLGQCRGDFATFPCTPAGALATIAATPSPGGHRDAPRNGRGSPATVAPVGLGALGGGHARRGPARRPAAARGARAPRQRPLPPPRPGAGRDRGRQ